MKKEETPHIPFNAPIRAVAQDRDGIDAAIARVLASGLYVLGPENDALSKELASFFGIGHAVLVGNGTDALEISLKVLGVGPTDVVATVANAGGYASTAIREVGATPFYVDIEPESLQMSPDALRVALQDKQQGVSAVIVTHLYGQAAKVNEIRQITVDAGVPLVEDCAQSIGAKSHGQRLGTFGDIATTSFYPTKNLGGLGDGGAIFTSSPHLAEKASRLRQYGWTSRYNSEESGGRNSRMDEIQAAVLRSRLKGLNRLNHSRKEIFSRYASVNSPWGKFAHSVSEEFVGHIAVFLTDDRAQFVEHLESRGIQTAIHYPIPDYRQPAFFASAEELPATEWASKRIVSLPLFPELREDEVERICLALVEGNPAM